MKVQYKMILMAGMLACLPFVLLEKKELAVCKDGWCAGKVPAAPFWGQLPDCGPKADKCDFTIQAQGYLTSERFHVLKWERVRGSYRDTHLNSELRCVSL